MASASLAVTTAWQANPQDRQALDLWFITGLAVLVGWSTAASP